MGAVGCCTRRPADALGRVWLSDAEMNLMGAREGRRRHRKKAIVSRTLAVDCIFGLGRSPGCASRHPRHPRPGTLVSSLQHQRNRRRRLFLSVAYRAELGVVIALVPASASPCGLAIDHPSCALLHVRLRQSVRHVLQRSTQQRLRTVQV